MSNALPVFHPSPERVAELQAALNRSRKRIAFWERQLYLNPRPLPDWVGDLDTLEE
jgi:hypothetical protein